MWRALKIESVVGLIDSGNAWSCGVDGVLADDRWVGMIRRVGDGVLLVFAASLI